jgi:CheY-like chemotaxis protein
MEHIKQTQQPPNTTVIMLTSSDQGKEVSRCRELGVAASLIKPIKQSELLDAILLVLDRPDIKPAQLAPGLSIVPHNAARSLRILLAEDNVVNQRLAMRLLEKRGHTVFLAGNGREALEAFDGEQFDLVLMDVQMPQMSGLEATVAIRAKESENGTHVPIVAMTAHAMKGDRERCLEAGMDGYVSKPIQAQTLFEEIEKVIEGAKS